MHQNTRADATRTLTFNLLQAFVSVLQAKSDLQFARDNLSNYKRTVDPNREMLKQGEIARADFLRNQLQMLQFETDLDGDHAIIRSISRPGSPDFEDARFACHDWA